jgi:tRNA pseudouridine55 synthase
MDGALVVDKPAGMTSHDVVDEVRRRLGTQRVGHGGTLDPDATGVLVIGVGKATRLLQYAQGAPKRYRAVARFGVTTTTQDASGATVQERSVDIDVHEVTDALQKFVGEIDQVPPMVSAVKVGGERLYRKARRGEEVERPARRVTIYGIELVAFESTDRGPQAEIVVGCSAGTYIRTLVHDVGEELGCGAHLISLRRIGAGGWSESDAVRLDEVTPEVVRPLVDIVRGLPVVHVDETEAALVADGRPLDAPDEAVEDGDVAAVVHDARLLAVYRRRGNDLIADRVVPQR